MQFLHTPQIESIPFISSKFYNTFGVVVIVVVVVAVADVAIVAVVAIVVVSVDTVFVFVVFVVVFVVVADVLKAAGKQVPERFPFYEFV